MFTFFNLTEYLKCLVPCNLQKCGKKIVNPSVLFVLHINNFQTPLECFQKHVNVDGGQGMMPTVQFYCCMYERST